MAKRHSNPSNTGLTRPPKALVSPQDSSVGKVRTNTRVNFIREELNNLLLIYYMIRDVYDGEPAIKGFIGTDYPGIPAASYNGGAPFMGDFASNIVITRALRYLPMPNMQDQSLQNQQRYLAYVTRAIFYNVTRRTVDGMTGQIFLRDPVLEIPNELDLIKADADGSGATLLQTQERVVRHCLCYGRAGIHVDYPSMTDDLGNVLPTTKKDLTDGNVRPIITVYNPWDIINWRTVRRGSKRILSMVVLRETLYEEGDDAFAISPYEVYKVLRLDDSGRHVVEVYREDDSSGFRIEQQYTVLGADGKPLDTIPFMFVGSQDNEFAPNIPPIYDLASLNLAHYRNSADYQDSCYLVGQPTPWASGVSQDWVRNVWKGSMPIGSRATIALPVGGQCGLMQAAPNSLVSESMKHIEEQMVALGAKLVQRMRTTRATATEVIVETTSESSTLANIANNVGMAFEWALNIAAQFVGVTNAKTKCTLNTDYDLTQMSPEAILEVIKVWQSGAITFSEMREKLRSADLATLDDAEALTTIQKEQSVLTMQGPVVDPTLTAPAGPPVAATA